VTRVLLEIDPHGSHFGGRDSRTIASLWTARESPAGTPRNRAIPGQTILPNKPPQKPNEELQPVLEVASLETGRNRSCDPSSDDQAKGIWTRSPLGPIKGSQAIHPRGRIFTLDPLDQGVPFLPLLPLGSRGPLIRPMSHGLSTEQVPVSAYVGSSKNLKDLKDQRVRGAGHWYGARVCKLEQKRTQNEKDGCECELISFQKDRESQQEIDPSGPIRPIRHLLPLHRLLHPRQSSGSILRRQTERGMNRPIIVW